MDILKPHSASPVTDEDTDTSSVNDEVSQATGIIEDLWAGLLQNWPAVKQNPLIAEQIEELWAALKAARGGELELPDEIQALLSTTSISPVIPASGTNIRPYQAQNTFASATSNSGEIDTLLAEILGDEYRLDTTKPDFSKTEQVASVVKNGSVTGSRELDDMVAAILGDGWEKEDIQATSFKSSPDMPVTRPPEPELSYTAGYSNSLETDENLDDIIASLISDDAASPHIIQKPLPASANEYIEPDNEQPGDDLLGLIPGRDTDSNKYTQADEAHSTLSQIEDEHNINHTADEYGELPELPVINADTIEHEVDISSVQNYGDIEEITGLEIHPSDEFINTTRDLKELIRQVGNTVKAADVESHKLSDNTDDDMEDDIIDKIAADQSEEDEQDVDILIQEVLKSTETPSDESTGIDTIIRHINDHGTWTEHEQAEEEQDSVQDLGRTKVFVAPARTEGTDKHFQATGHYEEKEEKYYQHRSERKSALVSLLLLVLFLAGIGIWQYMVLMDEQKPAEKAETADMAAQPEMNAIKDIRPVPETRTVPVTTQPETKPEVKPTQDMTSSVASLIGQPYTSPESEDQGTKTSAGVPSQQVIADNEYMAKIEKTEQDITIIVNEPVSEPDIALQHEQEPLNTNSEAPVASTEPAAIADKNSNHDKSVTVHSNMKMEQSGNTSITPHTENNKSSNVIIKRQGNKTIIIHTVVRGDTLWDIAKKYVNNPYKYPELAKLSKIRNPNKIYPGNKVRIIKTRK